MDYRPIVKQLIQEYARFKPAYSEIEPETVFDESNCRYQLLYVGWKKRKRVFAPIIHVDIIADKVWIQCDHTEEGIIDELIEMGIPKQKIIPAMIMPEAREYYGYPVE
jgi:hypothetical protein